MKDVFVSWSGGKDGTYARYLAKDDGLDIRYLLKMPNEDGKRSWTHRLSAPVLKLQSQGMGIPIIPHPTTTTEYEANFKKALSEAKPKLPVSGGVG